jgi:alanine racemase
MNNTSVIEISREALLKNIKFIRKIIGNDCDFVSVVKGNAYGHGIEYFVPLAYECGVRNFAVFSAFEAAELMETNVPFNRLIIMGAVDDSDIEWAIQSGIEFYIFDFERLQTAIKYANSLNKKAKIHIEIETGLNRTGFLNEDLKQLFEILKKHINIVKVKGLCSHLAGAENLSNDLRIKHQIENFKSTRNLFDANSSDYEKLHLSCSAGIINYPEGNFDMVRVGIMQYGFWPSNESKVAYLTRTKTNVDPLDRIISWKSKVMNVKSVAEGGYIGYGNSYLTEKKMEIAIVPVGYSNGFSRTLSNQGRVIINGVRVSIIGVVNMNMISVDVTEVPNVKKGDEVVLIGQQGDRIISVASFSNLSDQLNYELLTRLPDDIPRVITN